VRRISHFMIVTVSAGIPPKTSRSWFSEFRSADKPTSAILKRIPEHRAAQSRLIAENG